MRIIHYSAGVEEVGYLDTTESCLFCNLNESDKNEIYFNYKDPKVFISELENRIGIPDMVVLVAKSPEDFPLIEIPEEKRKSVMIDKSYLFKNNFIFDFSCSIEKMFGKINAYNDAVTYIGFNSDIVNTFNIDVRDDFEPTRKKQIENNLEKIFKRIYTECFNNQFIRFLKNCFTARKFYEELNFEMNLKITVLVSMSIEKMNEVYGTDFDQSEKKKINMVIRTEFLCKLNEVGKKMNLKGEGNYIPWYFIKYQSHKDLNRILEEIKYIEDPEAIHYKHFVEALVYFFKGDMKAHKTALAELVKISKTLNPNFEYGHVFDMEKISS